MGTKRKVTIVIPALNEEKGIGETIQSIPKDELEGFGYEVQILVVDNGSEDRTGELAQEHGAMVVCEPKRGYGYAYKAGFANVTGDIIVTADADCTYPMKDIPKFVNILEQENLDFITTNRFAFLEEGAMPFTNKLGNKVLSLTMRILFMINIKDSQSGMWIFRRTLLDKIKLRFNGMPLSEEIKIEACHFTKSNWKEIPINYGVRVGEVKLNRISDGIENLFCLIKKRVKR